MDSHVHLGHYRKSQGRGESHRSGVLLSMVTEIELGLHRNDGALLVMPMCHANSLNFFGAFGYCGGTNLIYSRRVSTPSIAFGRSRKAARHSLRWCRPTTS